MSVRIADEEKVGVCLRGRFGGARVDVVSRLAEPRAVAWQAQRSERV